MEEQQDITLQLKQALVKEQITNGLPKIPDSLYDSAKTFIESLQEPERQKMQTILNRLTFTRKKKIVTLAESGNGDHISKMTARERELFDAVSHAVREFES